MTAAWNTDLKASTKMVLLALCDNASDEGMCFPSIKTTAKKCSMSTRSVQGHIAKLIEKGYLKKTEREGRSSIYFIADPCKVCTPANPAPLQTTTQTPANYDKTPANPAPLQTTTQTPANYDKTPANPAPPPANPAPITITKPSHNHQVTTNKAREEIPKPNDVDEEVWNEFVKMRTRVKAPLSAYAAKLIAMKLDEFGGDKNHVLNQSIMNNWRGVFPLGGKSQKQPVKTASQIATENFYRKNGMELPDDRK